MYFIFKKLEPLLVLGNKYCVCSEVYKNKNVVKQCHGVRRQFYTSSRRIVSLLCIAAVVSHPSSIFPLVNTPFGHHIYY